MAAPPRDNGPDSFPPTSWTLVERAGAGGTSVQRAALDEIVRRYTPALRAYLLRKRRLTPDDAEEVLQSFSAEKFAETNLPAEADRARGRFRALLLTALNNHIESQRRKQHAIKRGGGRVQQFDPEALGHPASPEAPDPFAEEWVRQVLSQALEGMEAECRQRGCEERWRLFERRVVGPTLHGKVPPDYGTLLREFSFRTPAEVSNTLVTAKRMFIRHLRDVVRAYVSCDEDVDDELQSLLADIQNRAGAGRAR